MLVRALFQSALPLLPAIRRSFFEVSKRPEVERGHCGYQSGDGFTVLVVRPADNHLSFLAFLPFSWDYLFPSNGWFFKSHGKNRKDGKDLRGFQVYSTSRSAQRDAS